MVDVNVRVEPDSGDAQAVRSDLIFLILRTLELTITDQPLRSRQIFALGKTLTLTEQHAARVTEHFVDIVARRFEELPRNERPKFDFRPADKELVEQIARGGPL